MARHSSLVIALLAALTAPALVLLVAHRFAGGSAGLRPGDALPAYGLATLDGRLVDTSSWKGMPTLLVLFRSTCRACEREIAGLTQIAPSISGTRIVLLSLDSAAPRTPTALQTLCDPAGDFIRRLRKLAVPTLYVVDPRGKIAYVRTGERTPDDEFATLVSLTGPGR